jgi:ABC-type glutathione transport system ATPase component
MNGKVLELSSLKKHFRVPEGAWQPVPDIPQFSLEAGEQGAIQGESGMGKTTFLYGVYSGLPASGLREA